MRMRIAVYFGENFEISVKISRFHERFQDFGQDFEISRKISRFHVIVYARARECMYK